MANTNVYVKKVGALFVAIGLYVHYYIIITNDCKKLLPQTKMLFSANFEMTDMGGIEYYLGIQIKRKPQLHMMELNQSKYINDVLKIYGMKNCKPISTPLEIGLKLIKHQSPSSYEQT
jgi:hypothetical protein